MPRRSDQVASAYQSVLLGADGDLLERRDPHLGHVPSRPTLPGTRGWRLASAGGVALVRCLGGRRRGHGPPAEAQASASQTVETAAAALDDQRVLPE